MISAIFRVMMLGLLRDRAALAMAFALPPMIYVIFAAIFSVTAGGDLSLKIAILDQVHSQTTQRLVKALAKSSDIRTVAAVPENLKAIEDMVRKADIDAGVIIRLDPSLSALITSRPFLLLVIQLALLRRQLLLGDCWVFLMSICLILFMADQ